MLLFPLLLCRCCSVLLCVVLLLLTNSRPGYFAAHYRSQKLLRVGDWW